ncbi:hypothetical protein [Streptomyces sp. ITFR-6]|uniref:hypothetical protein n=1 Tax=Streptomyces sp. ITFR-6 TaxID=3075197 RepID=UPI00288A9EF7|nr:hypothetical protein [Streptomyces sp. ITFR-6]WNI29513.1 hypothetical protein RLT59_12500 [Streptomyces sp. ITFR-6]
MSGRASSSAQKGQAPPLLAAAELAAHCHPGLRPLRSAIQLPAERAADKTGRRRLTAQTIGHAALATRAFLTNRPTVTPAAASGPVPQRVAALLSAPVRRRHSVALASAALFLTACGSQLCAGAGAIGLTHSVEIAQGEASGP